MSELVDEIDLKSIAEMRTGSSPVTGIGAVVKLVYTAGNQVCYRKVWGFESFPPHNDCCSRLLCIALVLG